MTLRITQDDGPKIVTLKLEGELTGASACELDRIWKSVADTLGSKALILDIRGVTHLDTQGREILSEIHDASGAHFVADNPMTRYFAEQAQLKNLKDGAEEK